MLFFIRKFSDSLRRRGFTLVELVVVLVILLILLAVAIPTLSQYIDKAINTSLDVNTHYEDLVNQLTDFEKDIPTPSPSPTNTPD